MLAIYFYLGPRRYVSVSLLFALVTGFFQLVPTTLMVLPAVGVTKTYDWVLLFTGAMMLLKPQLFLDLRIWRSFKIMFLYGAVLTGLLLYSIFVKDVEVSVSVRVFRSLIYFLTIFLLVPLSQAELQKVFRLIVLITCLACIPYCLQLVVNKTLLSKITSDDWGEDSETVSRYYNLPVYIYPALFFLFFDKKVFSIKYRWVLMFFASLSILLSQHRNLLLAIVVCYFLYVVFKNGFKLQTFLLYSLLSVALIFGADFMWGSRFSQGLNDIRQVSTEFSRINLNEVTLSELTTTEFRQLLLIERWHFILKNDMSSLFGIGLVTDDSRAAAKLNFNVGMSDGYGNVAQIASGDIVWSVLLLQLGLVGTFAFVLFHVSLLAKFFSRRFDKYMQVGCLYVVCLLITSFYSNTISLPYTTTLLMLFCAYFFNLTQNAFKNPEYE